MTPLGGNTARTKMSNFNMETRTRSIVKAVSWQLVGLVTMTLLAFVVTGDLGAAGSLAIIGAISGFMCFFIHERVWAHIRWGRF